MADLRAPAAPRALNESRFPQWLTDQIPTELTRFGASYRNTVVKVRVIGAG